MENDVLIKVFLTDCCAICGKSHEVEIRKRDSQMLVRSEVVDYEEVYYLCPDGGYEDNEFWPAGIMDENLLRASDSYRRKHGLLILLANYLYPLLISVDLHDGVA